MDPASASRPFRPGAHFRVLISFHGKSRPDICHDSAGPTLVMSNEERWEDYGVQAPGGPEPEEDRHAKFPWEPILVAGTLALVHLGIVLFAVGSSPTTARFIRLGGLVAGPAMEDEPWRLFTSLFLHADLSHVFWNGVSMIVFAVPLILELRYTVTALIYLAGGILGGVAGVQFVPDGTVLIGSSGAVAGLFGAWVAITLLHARTTLLPRRARHRVLGVAFLVLPSLITPTTSTGHPVSVGSHLGGLAAGVLAGVILWSLGFVRVSPRPKEEHEHEAAGYDPDRDEDGYLM